MAPPETNQPRSRLRATSLFVVLVAAKGCAVLGRDLPFSLWTPFALAWEPAAIALGFAAFERFVRWRELVVSVYFALVVLAAVNAPVERVLGSPLTMSMLRATRTTLAGSIAHEATVANIAILIAILALGIAFPFFPERLATTGRPIRTLIAVLVIGLYAESRVHLGGLARQPLVSLVRTSFPRVRAAAVEGADFRAPLFGRERVEDLRELHGSARGANVLLVVLESAGAQYLKPWGATEDPMPNLTALAAGPSLVFENAYAAYPESVKGMVALFSSRFPAFDVSAERHAAVAIPSLPSMLALRGYTTALFHSGRFAYLGMDSILARTGFAKLEDAADIGGNRQSSFGVDEESTVHRVLQWIDSVPRGKPFLAAYLPIAGHHPYAYSGPGVFPDSTSVGRYRNALHEADAALGVLLAGLKSRGLDQKTLIVVVGDHGEAFEQHDGNVGHTLAIYEENIHVPLLFAYPWRMDGARRVARVASMVDVAPTILDLVGSGVPTVWDGRHLLSLPSRMALFFTDYSQGYLGLRDDCWKVIYELEGDRLAAYDLCHDPGERHSVGELEPDVAARYRATLRAWAGAQVAKIQTSR